MTNIMVYPRHGVMQEMMLKDQRWTAKAIAKRREEQHEQARSTGATAVGLQKSNSAGSLLQPSGAMYETASLLKSGNGSLLPPTTPFGPSVYYTGKGKRSRPCR
eukprot:TRINITY_DN11537_c0_g1_i1.p1 TRINITY_DN11537_c0_g1~~TRINITY_DN11537_c0_g1_i1.p1  ORF type:complete len:104 (+),score=21.91 TRINITY_DN11537_c0_g1_i1:68-379(+)